MLSDWRLRCSLGQNLVTEITMSTICTVPPFNYGTANSPCQESTSLFSKTLQINRPSIMPFVPPCRKLFISAIILLLPTMLDPHRSMQVRLRRVPGTPYDICCTGSFPSAPNIHRDQMYLLLCLWNTTLASNNNSHTHHLIHQSEPYKPQVKDGGAARVSG